MTETYFIQNGLLKKINEPSLYPYNRALLYGDGFFESLYAYNEQIPLIKYHLKRINKAFNVFEFEKNDLFLDVNELRKIIVFLARKNKLYKAYRVRITFYRSEGGLYKAQSNKINFIITVSKYPYEKLNLNNVGLIIDVFNDIKKDFSIISSFKTISPVSVLAMNYAKLNKLDDIIFLNHKNNVVETSNSNIFVQINNIIYTPKISEGCVNGIMRQVIIDILNNLNINIVETELNIDNLLNAQEIFLTNSVMGIRFVSAFRTKRYFNFSSKKIYNELIKTFF